MVWGEDNRTCGFRAVGHGDGRRIESRIPGADANPYLALAAMIGAGLDGIDRDLDPGLPNSANLFELTPAQLDERGIRSMPPTLLHAVEMLETDPVIRAALGKTPGGEYIDYFASTKRREFFEFHAQVTPWEVDHYSALF